MKKFLRETSQYYVVSIFTLIINLAIYWLLIHYTRTNYLLAAVIGFVIENILAYLLNRYWTFTETRIKFEKGYIRSLLVALFILGVVLLFTIIGVRALGLDKLSARIFAAIIAGIISYVLDAEYSFKVW